MKRTSLVVVLAIAAVIGFCAWRIAAHEGASAPSRTQNAVELGGAADLEGSIDAKRVVVVGAIEPDEPIAVVGVEVGRTIREHWPTLSDEQFEQMFSPLFGPQPGDHLELMDFAFVDAYMRGSLASDRASQPSMVASALSRHLAWPMADPARNWKSPLGGEVTSKFLKDVYGRDGGEVAAAIDELMEADLPVIEAAAREANAELTELAKQFHAAESNAMQSEYVSGRALHGPFVLPRREWLGLPERTSIAGGQGIGWGGWEFDIHLDGKDWPELVTMQSRMAELRARRDDIVRAEILAIASSR